MSPIKTLFQKISPPDLASGFPYSAAYLKLSLNSFGYLSMMLKCSERDRTLEMTVFYFVARESTCPFFSGQFSL